MALTCNIDARGKRARLVSGILLLIGAAAAALLACSTGSRLTWVLASLMAIAGAFTIFEARAG